MTIPKELKYTKEHEWIRLDDGIATVGITDYAQSELGDIVYVEVDTLDEFLEKDEVFGTVEAVKTTSDLYMPLSGKIVEFNPQLNESEGDNPGCINEDTYGAGWIVKMEISDLEQIEGLLSSEEYGKLII